jgi:hypothetical protein
MPDLLADSASRAFQEVSHCRLDDALAQPSRLVAI